MEHFYNQCNVYNFNCENSKTKIMMSSYLHKNTRLYMVVTKLLTGLITTLSPHCDDFGI